MFGLFERKPEYGAAIQYDGNNAQSITALTNGKVSLGGGLRLKRHTLFGMQFVEVGDWVLVDGDKVKIVSNLNFQQDYELHESARGWKDTIYEDRMKK